MMVRTQISLTEDQHDAISRLAASRGVSMSALIREAVDQLVRASGKTAAQALLDLAREHPLPGAAHVGVHHDDHLASGNW